MQVALAVYSADSKVCALKTRKQSPKDLLGVAADGKDLRLFLQSTMNGHRSGDFGGKEGLWDFLKMQLRI